MAAPQPAASPSTTPAPQASPAPPPPTAAPAQTVTVVQVVTKPTRETSVGDILLGSVGFVGFILLAGLLVGLLAGAVFVAFKRLRPGNAFNGQTADDTALRLNE
jgi:hypothetical protein